MADTERPDQFYDRGRSYISDRGFDHLRPRYDLFEPAAIDIELINE